jgi:hypothetical protein
MMSIDFLIPAIQKLWIASAERSSSWMCVSLGRYSALLVLTPSDG